MPFLMAPMTFSKPIQIHLLCLFSLYLFCLVFILLLYAQVKTSAFTIKCCPELRNPPFKWWTERSRELCLFSKYPELCKHSEGFHQKLDPRENKGTARLATDLPEHE